MNTWKQILCTFKCYITLESYQNQIIYKWDMMKSLKASITFMIWKYNIVALLLSYLIEIDTLLAVETFKYDMEKDYWISI